VNKVRVIKKDTFIDTLIVAKECIRRYTFNYAILLFLIVNTIFLSVIIYDHLYHITIPSIAHVTFFDIVVTMLMISMVISAFMVIAVAVNEFGNEIEKGTLHILLTAPPSREAIFFGKTLGLMFIPLLSVIVNIMYVVILITILGFPPIFITIQYIILLILFLVCTFSVCNVSVFVSLLGKKVILSLPILIIYLIFTFIGASVVLSTASAAIEAEVASYHPDYMSIWPFPLITFAETSNSLQAMGIVDTNLIITEITFSILTLLGGYLLFRRIEL